jgi:hypothetical protein
MRNQRPVGHAGIAEKPLDPNRGIWSAISHRAAPRDCPRQNPSAAHHSPAAQAILPAPPPAPEHRDEGAGRLLRKDQGGRAARRGRKEARTMKVTKYFKAIRSRPDRAITQDEWILRVIASPEREFSQADGRAR